MAKSGGDFTLLSAALASITDNSPSKPYVVKIAPGEYTETGPVTMKNFVDVEGSGQGVTTLTCACGSSGDSDGPFVIAENITAEIRHLTVDNIGGDEYSVAVYTSGVVDGRFSMLHVTATAKGSSSDNRGVYNVNSSSPSMNHVTAIAAATGSSSINHGVSNSGGSPSMNNVTAIATGGSTNHGVSNFNGAKPSMSNTTVIATSDDATGVLNSSGSVTIRGSSITGDTRSVNNGGGSDSRIAATTLGGPIGGSGHRCVGVHNEDFVAFDTTCSNLLPWP